MDIQIYKKPYISASKLSAQTRRCVSAQGNLIWRFDHLIIGVATKFNSFAR
jgi:hypothetical protein